MIATLRPCLKSVVVGLAIRGMLPRRLADWFIAACGLQHI